MKELTLEAKVENIQAATDFIDRELEAVDCPLKAQMRIDVAIDEIFANIAHYAYKPGTGDVTVQFAYDAATQTAFITFIDSGIPYNPLEKKDPDTTLSAEDRAVGGLGIFLVKKTMDNMRYWYADGRNHLILEKKLS